MKKMFEYHTNCVESTMESINTMKDAAGPIEYDTFYRKVNKQHWTTLQKGMGYSVGNEKGLHIKDDPHVAYFSSKFEGMNCVYVTWSAVEYIFVEVK